MSHDVQLLWISIRKRYRLVLATVLFSLAAAFAETFSIGLLIPFLQTFSGGAEDVFRTNIAWIDQHLLAVDGSKLTRTYHVCGLILVATLLRSILKYVAGVSAVLSRVRIVEDLRHRILEQLQRVSLQYFSKQRGGDLINSITTETSRTTAAVAVVFNSIQHATLLMMYLGLMLWISMPLTLIVGALFGLLALGLTTIMAGIREEGTRLTRANSWLTSRFSEFIEGARTIQAYNRQAYEEKRIGGAIRELADATVATFKRQSLVMPLAQGIVGSAIVVLIVVGVQFYVIPGAMDIAYLLGFLLALFRLMPAFHELNNQRSEWASNRGGLAQVATLLDPAGKPSITSGTKPVPAFRDRIVFEQVDFEYEPNRPILKDVNLEIKAGTTVALVGGSGAGKSTLADLIPRFHDPVNGRILMDGTDLREFDLHALRDKIGIVSQSTYVFNDTLRANIGYGNLQADDAAIRLAAEKANALGFIEEMDEGFDTMLGDRGIRVSGGQRQRIAIARAILKDPEILILDEATSSLDSVSERLVQESLDELMKGRTVIAIAHRLSTIESADWVIVLEQGRVVEEGPYDELLQRRGWLWKYHCTQHNNGHVPARAK
jgi:subfamily B ATP-binding cassette protein MsbA